jgi:hypothetical protein
VLSHQFGTGIGHPLQHRQIAAVIVRQRPHALGRTQRAFEVHLPEFVGRVALKPLRRQTRMLRLVDQAMPQQNAVDRAPRQLHAPLPQQHLQFARSPIRIPLP